MVNGNNERRKLSLAANLYDIHFGEFVENKHSEVSLTCHLLLLIRIAVQCVTLVQDATIWV